MTERKHSDWLLSANHSRRERDLVELVHKYLIAVRGVLTDEVYLDFLDEFVKRVSAVARRMDLKYDIVNKSRQNWTSNNEFPWRMGDYEKDVEKLS